MTTLEDASLPPEPTFLSLKILSEKLPKPGFILAALMATFCSASFMYLVYEVMVGDAEWYEALTLLLTTALLVAYFTSVLVFPCLTVGAKKYRFATLIFIAPVLSAVGFTLYTVLGNIRDVDNVWSEAVRILWYGLVGLAPIGGAYTLADDYEGGGRWLLHLKPHFKKEEK